MVYVDLNPIRAAITDNQEDSDYTSIQERISSYAEKMGKRRNNKDQKAAQEPEEQQNKQQTQDYLELADWTDSGKNYGRRFHTVSGSLTKVQLEAAHYFHSLTYCVLT